MIFAKEQFNVQLGLAGKLNLNIDHNGCKLKIRNGTEYKTPQR